jgi:hypothetical protein
MIMKFARKQYKECMVVFLCLFVAGNLAHGIGLCIVSHDNVDRGVTSHKAHTASVHSHRVGGRESHEAGSFQQCCPTPLKIPADCVRFFTLLNKNKTAQDFLTATQSTWAAISCFQFSEKNLISEISNTINPTLVSLRTVVLLV